MSMPGVVARAIGAFVATDLDGLVLLALLYSVRRDAASTPRSQVVTGTFAGFTVLVMLSAAVAAGLHGVPVQWFALFGIVPLSIGMWGLARLWVRSVNEPPPVLADAGILTVAAITIANGGDNVSVYIPLFRDLDAPGFLATCVVFAVLLGLWCALGALVAGRTRVVHLIERAGNIAVPLIFVTVGVVILSSLVS